MLSAYVNEHHTDWDDQIPFVMMAYRSAVLETTGCTPNKIMLGRETCTPLDIIHDIPRNIKQIPAAQWAWELHRMVQQTMGEAIHGQKKYHDKITSWEHFEKGEKVYVHVQAWRGPYKNL